MIHDSDISSSSISIDTRLLWIAGTVVALLLACCSASAQTGPTDGMTPSGLAPGAAAGSYGLSGFDNVNLYNGNLNFSMRLLGIGGRGGAQTQMTMNLDSVHWTVEKDLEFPTYYPVPNWWEGIRPGYGPGVLQARVAMVQAVVNPNSRQTLTRLTFTAPDGTEYELIDTLNGGRQYYSFCNPSTRPRGRTFVSHEGTAFITFVSNATIYDQCVESTYSAGISGYLYFPDGARYEINDGVVTRIRDRNGNLISFAYDANKRVTGVTDSLNRQVTVSYADMVSVFYDQIVYKGFGGIQRSLKVWRTSLSQALRAGYTVQTYAQLFPNLNGSDGTIFNPNNVVSAVELPDGRRYQFFYNPYDELARVALPTGGAVEYDYVEMGGFSTIQRRVSERRVYADGTNLESKQVYTATYNGTTTTVVEQRDASNNLLSKSQHYFYNNPISSINNAYNSSLSYSNWQEGREFKSESLAADGVTVLRRVENTWEQGATVTSWLLTSNAANNPRVSQTVSTLVDTNQVAQQTFTHDGYNNTTDVYEYDFGSGAAGPLVRREHTDFMTTNPVNSIDYTSSTNNLYFYRLPSQTQIFDAGGVEKARTTYEYDNYAGDGSHAPLTDRSLISGLDSTFTTANQTRVNVTRVGHWILSSGTPIYSYSQFDIAGSLVKSIDPRGYATTFDYADCFGTPNGEARTNIAPTELASQSQTSFALLTSVTNALGQKAFGQYDYYTGKAVDGEDMNGVVASGYYNDVLDRPTQVIRDANNLAAKSQINFTYDDVNHIVTTKSDFSALNDNLLRKDSLYDGLGRTTETRAYENATQYITVKQVPFVVLQDPDTLGFVAASQSSNPYRSYLGEQPVWTTAFSDALGRTTKVRTPDNAIARNSYSGNTVTVTDQAGKARKSVSDALGRLTTVYEDPNGVNYQTSYSYDVLDDLITVNQGVQTRTFVYDSLKRLTSATNPESGIVSHQYDNNGNLTQRTDARNIVTTIAYDALNRVSSRTYSDGTPTVTYTYDSASVSYSKGRLTSVSSSASTTNYTAFDALGRVTSANQVTDGQTYSMSYAYNVSGAQTSMTYPSGRVITSEYDSAGRLAGVRDQSTGIYYAGAASTDATNRLQYAAHGAVSVMKLGNGLWEHTNFNNRLQPTQIGLGTSSTDSSTLGLNYDFGTTTNNGNLQSVSYSGGGLSFTQSFGYDALNRLTTSNENSGSSWSQTNGYDQYGNRWIDYGGGVHNLNFSTNTNRITNSGYSYDAAGNLTNDTVHSYTFDGENKIKGVDGASDVYRYDGDGNRVRKNFAAGEQLRMVYSGGQLIAEYDLSTGSLKKEYVYGAKGLIATIEPSTGTRYLTTDNLGSPRVVTNSSGAVVSRHDFMPFGEELLAGTGGRTTAMGYSAADNLRQKFTGYQRDAESGLDFAQARYFSFAQARFTSPDPFAGSATIGDPQSFNRYTYVGNNPVNVTDPTGLSGDGPGGSLPGAEGALGRLTGNNGVFETDWSGNAAQHWMMPYGGTDAEVEAALQASAQKPIVPCSIGVNISGQTSPEDKIPLQMNPGGSALKLYESKFSWGQTVEVNGTIQGDPSDWTMGQVVTSRFRAIYNTATGPFTMNLGRVIREPNDAPNPGRYQWGPGDKFFWQDSPGINKAIPGQSVRYADQVQNFTSYVTSQKLGLSCSVTWSTSMKIVNNKVVGSSIRLGLTPYNTWDRFPNPFRRR